jgi:hypothetical protein
MEVVMTEKCDKKTYVKPELRSIELAADEVLGVGCKSNKGGFNVGASPCLANKCVKKGS